LSPYKHFRRLDEDNYGFTLRKSRGHPQEIGCRDAKCKSFALEMIDLAEKNSLRYCTFDFCDFLLWYRLGHS
jgi:hypothetical protein